MFRFIQTKRPKKLVIVVLISFLGILFSELFLKPKKEISLTNDETKIVAEIVTTENEVQRQSTNQLTWDIVEAGSKLKIGDKVKTNSKSTATIKFKKNNTTLDVEKNSVIVVDQKEDKFEVQLLTGNLYIKQKEKDQSINIFSGADEKKEKIELKNAEATISINSKGESSVDIIRGNAMANGKDLLANTNIFEDIEPNYGETKYTFNQSEKIIFKWKPLDNNFSVSLEIGKDRNNLAKDKDQKIKIESGFIELNLRPDTYFWRLSALNNKTGQIYNSSIYKLNLDPLYAPKLALPNHQQEIRFVDNEPQLVEFKWALPTPLKNIKILISEKPNLQDPIVNELVTKQTYFENKLTLKEGKYYWKVFGNIGDTAETISSDIFSFSMIKGKVLNAPELIAPPNNHIEYVPTDSKFNEQIVLNWKTNSETSKFILTIKNKNIKKEITTTVPSYVFSISNNQPYTWYVQSVDEYGKKSPISESWNFTFSKQDKLNLQSKAEKEYFYVNDLPTTTLSWQANKDAQKYVIYISQSSQFTLKEKLETIKNEIEFKFPYKGHNYIQIEAIDKNLQSVAKSDIIDLEAKERTLPSPPEVAKAFSKGINSNLDGSFEIAFNDIANDEKIQIEVRNLNNDIIEKSTNNSINFKFQDYKPGQYYIWAKRIDAFGRLSDYSQKINITVPEKSLIKTPKIKNIKIK